MSTVQLQSPFFRENQALTLSSEFSRDLAAIIGLGEQQLGHVLDGFEAYILGESREEDSAALWSLAHQTGLGQEGMEAALRQCRFMARAFTRDENTVEALVHDLTALGSVDEAGETALRFFLETLQQSVHHKLRSTTLRREFERVGIPRFNGIATQADLRAVVGNYYRDGDRLDTYGPKISDLVPIPIIYLTLEHAQHEKEVFFQTTPRGLDRLIAHLQACRIDIAALEEHCKPLATNDMEASEREGESS